MRIFKPNMTSLGYALFLAINATGVWGGVFPFLPIGFQTSRIIFFFFLSQSLVFTFIFFASALGVYFLPGLTRRFLVIGVGLPYLFGWVCLIAAMYINTMTLPFTIAGGILLGSGSAGFYMLWQRLFSSQDPTTGNHDLILGTLYSAVIYLSLYIIPRAVTTYLIPTVFLPLFGLCIVLKSRGIDSHQPMFEDIPRRHPQVYRHVITTYWRSAFSMGVMGFCCGIMRALAIDDPQIGSLVNIMSMGGSFLAAATLLLLWQVKNLKINVVSVYRFFFPFLITAFLLIPMLGNAFSSWFAGFLYAFFSCAIMLMMIQCAQASRDQGINPVFIYGFFGGVVYMLHDFGYLSATLISQTTIAGIAPNTTLSLVALYLLGFMYFIGLGGFKQIGAPGAVDPNDIEFIALQVPTENRERHGTVPVELPAPIIKPSPQRYRDRVSKQCAAIQRRYRLSARETEVMELIARSNSVPMIAEELVVSENTVRTHSKRIYTKLGIHKKQELVNLIEEFDTDSILSLPEDRR